MTGHPEADQGVLMEEDREARTAKVRMPEGTHR